MDLLPGGRIWLLMGQIWTTFLRKMCRAIVVAMAVASVSSGNDFSVGGVYGPCTRTDNPHGGGCGIRGGPTVVVFTHRCG